MTRTLTLLILALLAGCTCEPIEGHGPLNEICERVKLPWKHSDNVYTTVGTNVYTTSLERFNARHPHGSVEREALLRHEQVHARRQFDYLDLPGEMALWTWIARYTTDAKFMWQEEQHALYAGIIYLKEQGRWNQQDTFEKAEGLERSYRTVTGKKMISFSEAVEWINQVLGGQWKP